MPRLSLDLTPEVGAELARVPVRMDRRRHARMIRGKLDPEARIDLHGMTLAEAQPALAGFILSSRARGLRLVLVITGKGRTRPVDDLGPIPRRPGALKVEVPRWLRSGALASAVLEIREAHHRHGGTGAYYVYLRKSG
jgi:DNA-nicking Smr family endonuclease